MLSDQREMSVPYAYTVKNISARKGTTTLTAGGMALVVYVFAAMLMVAEGLEKTLIGTGNVDNVVVIRRGSDAEIQSAVERDQAAIISSLPEIGTDGSGNRMLSKELIVLVGLPKRGTDRPSNVTVRGLSDAGLRLRSQVKIAKGRMFRTGSSEVVVGKGISEAFRSAGIGGRLKLGAREWTVVGILDAGSTGFDSEIWGDVGQLMQAFRRETYSSVVFRLKDGRGFDKVAARIDSDQRLTHRAVRETAFYAAQSKTMADFLRIFGITLSLIFSTGAVIGATITMHSAVASRTTEIATLRAIGFQRMSVLVAFLAESLLLGFAGGVVGLVLASGMQFLTISTMNLQTFSELAFSLRLTPAIVVESLVFAVAMGFVGGFLPALRAARLNIIDALRAG
jgi:putative ABC transport system permease protein